METHRCHYIVHSERNCFLDVMFRKKATKVSYEDGKYILYFKKAVPTSRLQNYCGDIPCKIEPVICRPSKKEKKEQKSDTNEEKKCCMLCQKE